jgi:hypothetical protein
MRERVAMAEEVEKEEGRALTDGGGVSRGPLFPSTLFAGDWKSCSPRLRSRTVARGAVGHGCEGRADPPAPFVPVPHILSSFILAGRTEAA